MTQRGLVLDIETVPDPAAVMAVRAASRAPQGRVWLHRLAAVSVLKFSETSEGHFDGFALKSLQVAPRAQGPGLGEIDVLRAIDALVAGLGLDGVLVTFNGRRHDVPFLCMRRRHHGLFRPCALDRFVEVKGVGHADVMQLLAAEGLRWPSLEDACAAFDIPHEPHGAISAVPAVLRKCETDVLATFLLYLVDRASRERSARCLLAGWRALGQWCLRGPAVAHRRQFVAIGMEREAKNSP